MLIDLFKVKKLILEIKNPEIPPIKQATSVKALILLVNLNIKE
jgi:hypothetical protein